MRLPWRRENSEKAPDIPWFWTLTIDGRPAANFDWPDILQGLEGLRAELTNPNARFLAAVSGEAMAGYLGLHAVCGEGYIANLAVAPAFRRQGVARALLRAGAKIAEKEKLEFLSLEVRTSNLPARRLYESEGYVHIGARPGFYTNPREDGEIYTKRFGGSL